MPLTSPPTKRVSLVAGFCADYVGRTHEPFYDDDYMEDHTISATGEFVTMWDLVKQVGKFIEKGYEVFRDDLEAGDEVEVDLDISG